MLVYFALVFTVLIGFCGLALDIGRMEARTVQLQAAVDAGAIASASEIMHNDTSGYQTAANADVALYESLNNLPSTVPDTVVVGASGGPYSLDYSAITVTLHQAFATVFMGMLSKANSTVTLGAKAIAVMPPCMWFSGNPGVSNSGYTVGFYNASAGMDTSLGCPIYSKTGILVDGFARIAGSQVKTSSPASASCACGNLSVTPIYNVPVISDPLAYLTAPTAGSCLNAMPISMVMQSTATIITLSPGTYCGKTASWAPSPSGCWSDPSTTITPAINIQGNFTAAPYNCASQASGNNGGNCTSMPTVNFLPGLYIIIGGMNLDCVHATGTGVTFYFTKSTTVGFADLWVQSSTWYISAPNDTSAGGIPGIAVMNDRSWALGTQDFNWTYTTIYADGIYYLTNTGLNGYNLNMSAPDYMNVVASNMYSYDGEIRPSINYQNLSGGSPLHTVATLVQ